MLRWIRLAVILLPFLLVSPGTAPTVAAFASADASADAAASADATASPRLVVFEAFLDPN